MNYETYYQNVKENDIFIAIKGNHYDGHDFIEQAFKNGAKKAIGEQKLNLKNYKRVKNTRKYLTKVISKENKKLASDFNIIGITGTKGKTTTAMITYQMLRSLKVKCAYIGTLGLIYNDVKKELNNTTPDILTLNRILRELKNNDIHYIVMEISSHALVEERIKGLNFKICAFTNLSQDHLDYHETMENYLNAKLKILKYLAGPIVVNFDDKASIQFIKRSRNFITVGTNGNYKLNDYNLHETNSLINFQNDYNHYTVAIPYIGKYNVYNYLMAVSIVKYLGYDIYDIINITNNLKNIPGRNELLKTSKGYIVIDYAHSPSSLKETLQTYNQLKKNRIITIIGCGGNRDKSKRSIMGNIATELSDYVIFTSDNPRDEDPKEILKDMTKDLQKKNFLIIENREEAIKKGVKLLKNKDYLLILGKGHENYQIRRNIKYHFDDKEVVSKYLN